VTVPRPLPVGPYCSRSLIRDIVCVGRNLRPRPRCPWFGDCCVLFFVLRLGLRLDRPGRLGRLLAASGIGSVLRRLLGLSKLSPKIFFETLILNIQSTIFPQLCLEALECWKVEVKASACPCSGSVYSQDLPHLSVCNQSIALPRTPSLLSILNSSELAYMPRRLSQKASCMGYSQRIGLALRARGRSV
jgi:hypothetical protein